MSWRLYLSTPPQISNDALEGEARLGRSLLESGQVVRVFGETRANRVVNKIREGALGLGSLVPKCLVNLRLKIDRGPLWLSAHGPTIVLKHHDVKTSKRTEPAHNRKCAEQTSAKVPAGSWSWTIRRGDQAQASTT